jgi:hypothetical protein
MADWKEGSKRMKLEGIKEINAVDASDQLTITVAQMDPALFRLNLDSK